MKKYVILSIVFLIIIATSLFFFFKKESKQDDTIYTAITTIKEHKNFSTVSVLVDDKEMLIHSNIFAPDDKVKIEYQKSGKEYNITKIEALSSTKAEKSNLISNMKNDVTLNRYKKLLKGYADISNEEWAGNSDKWIITHYDVLPEKISNQYYKTITPSEFFENKYYLMDIDLPITPKDLNIIFTSEVDFEVLNIYNEKDDIINEIIFQSTNNSFSFKSVGQGIYSAKIKFNNGDIINYIFV